MIHFPDGLKMPEFTPHNSPDTTDLDRLKTMMGNHLAMNVNATASASKEEPARPPLFENIIERHLKFFSTMGKLSEKTNLTPLANAFKEMASELGYKAKPEIIRAEKEVVRRATESSSVILFGDEYFKTVYAVHGTTFRENPIFGLAHQMRACSLFLEQGDLQSFYMEISQIGQNPLLSNEPIMKEMLLKLFA